LLPLARQTRTAAKCPKRKSAQACHRCRKAADSFRTINAGCGNYEAMTTVLNPVDGVHKVDDVID
jgi:hypothetical protein